jgi:hypothetical protein
MVTQDEKWEERKEEKEVRSFGAQKLRPEG